MGITYGCPLHVSRYVCSYISVTIGYRGKPRYSKVGNFGVKFTVEQYVVRFNVAVNDGRVSFSMKIQDSLGCSKSDSQSHRITEWAVVSPCLATRKNKIQKS